MGGGGWKCAPQQQSVCGPPFWGGGWLTLVLSNALKTVLGKRESQSYDTLAGITII